MSSYEKGWKEVSIAGVCWLPSTKYLTGDWSPYKPVRDKAKCNKCLLCHMYCPDGAVIWNSKAEDIEFNYNFCKGCGICANECPQGAIEIILK